MGCMVFIFPFSSVDSVDSVDSVAMIFIFF